MPPAVARARAGWRVPVQRALLHRAAKPLAFALGLLPLAHLVWGVFADALGANPAEALIRSTGDWTLRALCLALAVTPLRQATGLVALARFRRMAGLFAAFYGMLHFLCFAWLDMGWDAAAILADIAKRPFILVGTAALLTMLPLVATSFDAAVRSLGAARWRALHRLVFATVALALLHFLWMRSGKNLYAEVAVYAAIVAALLAWRVRGWMAARTRSRGSPAGP